MHSLLSSLALANPMGHRSQDPTHRSPQCPLVAMEPAVALSFPELGFLRRSWLKGLWAMTAMSPVPEMPPCLPWKSGHGAWVRAQDVGQDRAGKSSWTRPLSKVPSLYHRPHMTSPGPSDHMTIRNLTGRTGYHPNKEAGKPRSGSSLTWAKSRSCNRGSGLRMQR